MKEMKPTDQEPPEKTERELRSMGEGAPPAALQPKDRVTELGDRV